MAGEFENLIMRDTRANQPAAGIPGRLYYVTDENLMERDNGATWENVESAAGTGVARSGSTTDGHLAVWNGSDADSIKDGGVANVFAPWLVNVNPMMDELADSVGSWALAGWAQENKVGPYLSSNVSTVAVIGLSNGAGAQNDYAAWDIVLSAGTWNATFFVRKSTNTGIITLLFDDVSAGTVDTYAAAVAYTKVQITGITISANGKTRMKIQAATKNASSSGYNLGLFGISFRRTA